MSVTPSYLLKRCAFSAQCWIDALVCGQTVKEDLVSRSLLDAADSLAIKLCGINVVKKDANQFDIAVDAKYSGNIIETLGIVRVAGVTAEELIENRIRCMIYASVMEAFKLAEEKDKIKSQAKFVTKSAEMLALHYALTRGLKETNKSVFMGTYRKIVASGAFVGLEVDSIGFYSVLDAFLIKFCKKFQDGFLTSGEDLDHYMSLQMGVSCIPVESKMFDEQMVFIGKNQADIKLHQQYLTRVQQPIAGEEIIHIDPFGNYLKGTTMKVPEKVYPKRLNKKFVRRFGRQEVFVVRDILKTHEKINTLDLTQEEDRKKEVELFGDILDSVAELGPLDGPIDVVGRQNFFLKTECISELVYQNCPVKNGLLREGQNVINQIEEVYQIVKPKVDKLKYGNIFSPFEKLMLERVRLLITSKVLSVGFWNMICNNARIREKMIYILIALEEQVEQICAGFSYSSCNNSIFILPPKVLSPFIDKLESVTIEMFMHGVITSVKLLVPDLEDDLMDALVYVEQNNSIILVYGEPVLGLNAIEEVVLGEYSCGRISTLLEKLQIGGEVFEAFMSNVCNVSLHANMGKYGPLEYLALGSDKNALIKRISLSYTDLFGISIPRIHHKINPIGQQMKIQLLESYQAFCDEGTLMGGMVRGRQHLVLPAPGYLLSICALVRYAIGLPKLTDIQLFYDVHDYAVRLWAKNSAVSTPYQNVMIGSTYVDLPKIAWEAKVKHLFYECCKYLTSKRPDSYHARRYRNANVLVEELSLSREAYRSMENFLFDEYASRVAEHAEESEDKELLQVLLEDD